MKESLKYLAYLTFLSLHLITGWMWPVYIMAGIVWVMAAGVVLVFIASLSTSFSTLNPGKFAFQKFLEHHRHDRGILDVISMAICVTIVASTFMSAEYLLTLFAYGFVVFVNFILRLLAKLSRGFY